MFLCLYLSAFSVSSFLSLPIALSLPPFISFLHLSLSVWLRPPSPSPLFWLLPRGPRTPSLAPLPGPTHRRRRPGRGAGRARASAQSRAACRPAERSATSPAAALPALPGSRRPAWEEMLAVSAKIPGRLRAFLLQREPAPSRDPASGGAMWPGWASPQEGAAPEPPRLPLGPSTEQRMMEPGAQ